MIEAGNGGAPILSIEGLSTHFRTYEGTARVLDGVTFSVRRGEFLGVVGETGCGKSVTGLSILRILPRNGRIVSGRIIYGDTGHGESGYRGTDLTALSDGGMRKIRGGKIGMIFQHPQASLNPVFTIREQMEAAMRVHAGSVPGGFRGGLPGRGQDSDRRAGRRTGIQPGIHGELRERAFSLLQRVGLPEPAAVLRKYPHELSGGMQQRVMIATALSSSPDLLIADEPTTALDVTIQAQILALMARLRDETGMGVMFITHNMGVVASVCDSLVVMYAGQVVETGPVSGIFSRPLHPYTRGLLASIPAYNQTGALRPIPGGICSLIDPPEGCRFHPRCEYRLPVCAERRPGGKSPAGDPTGRQGPEENHIVFCHLYDEGSGPE